MAEQARPDQAAAEEATEKQPVGQKPVGLFGRLLTRKWLLILLALSVVGHVIGLTYSQLRATRPAGGFGPEVSLGVFRFVAEPEEGGGIVSAEFRLHIALLSQVEARARQEISGKRLRVQQSVEELVRRAHGGDFDDPLLAGLKQQLQEQINETLGIRVIDDVIITELKLERREGPGETTTEMAKSLPWTETPRRKPPDAERQGLDLAGQ
ncbi:MAG TPA: hypothetical protein VMY37_32605 [Thermoguttaceae bacterium]|nr:hypothetical protein [Thermoguttaceae bacterium]